MDGQYYHKTEGSQQEKVVEMAEAVTADAEPMEEDEVNGGSGGGGGENNAMDTTSSMMTDDDDDGDIASGMNVEDDSEGGGQRNDCDEVLASNTRQIEDQQDPLDRMTDGIEDDDDAMNVGAVGERVTNDTFMTNDDDGEQNRQTYLSKPSIISASSTTKITPTDMTLHDWLSLGEIEKGLDACRSCNGRDKDATDGITSKNQDADDCGERVRSEEELERLPLLLRLLNQTRPLADICTIGGGTSGPSRRSPSQLLSSISKTDPLINRVVDRLEDVAATYSAAEGVDVVGNYLTPALCKKISRLTVPVPKRRRTDIITDALKQQNTNGELVTDDNTKRFIVSGYDYYYYENEWDLHELEDVAEDPLHRPTKRKRGMEGDVLLSEDSVAEGSDDDGDPREDPSTGHSSTGPARLRDSVEMAGEDSQESTVLKTLSEVVGLVISSLQAIGTNHHESSSGRSQGDSEETGEQPKTSERDAGSGLGLTIEDSMLSEKGGGTGETVSSGIKSTTLHGSDLGSTLASIMHFSPVLQSRHVATAICRASLPQSEYLLRRIAANCPATVPSLLLGCLDAYIMALDHGNTSIAKISKRGVSALAKLSKSEAITVQSKLRSLGIMYDVQLRLNIDTDNVVDVAVMLIQHLLPLVSLSNHSNECRGREMHENVIYSEGCKTSEKMEDVPFSEPTLLEHFSQSPDLLNVTIIFISKMFQKTKNEGNRSTGFWCLIMQAFGTLMMVPFVIDNTLSILSSLNGLIEWIDKMEVGISRSDFNGFVMAASILVASRALNGDGGSKETLEKSLLLMETTSKIGSRNISIEVWRCIDQLVGVDSRRGLFLLLCSLLAGDNNFPTEEDVAGNPSYRTVRIGLKRLCNSIRNRVNFSVDKHLEMSTMLLTLYEGIEKTTLIRDDGMEMLKSLLKPQSVAAVYNSEILLLRAVQFVAKFTKALTRAGIMRVPLIMQADLEFSLLTLEANEANGCVDTNVYLLRFLHALEFSRCNPTSPFAIDPCSSSIRESRALVERLSSGRAKSFLELEILEWLQKLNICNTVWWDEHHTFGHGATTCVPHSTRQRGELKASLVEAIRQEIRDGETASGEGRNAERFFSVGKSCLVDTVLYPSVVSALLTPPSDPIKVFSFDVLCRDPIIIFKSPVIVWRCKGLRRIALSTLNALMRTNESIVKHSCRSDESAMEFLAARDLVILRCLLASSNKTDTDKSSIVCGALTGFIRFLVASRPGVLAMLLKQGLEETDLDWMVENVPETMINDPQDYLSMLSERSPLTAAERLVAADAIVRIAIVHGNNSEEGATMMLSASLSKLVDSFYVILGPIGDIPVNSVLAVDDSSADTVQVARKAAFRILKALTKLRGTGIRMKKEAGTALHKLASMCKAESASSGRRKLVNQIFDATSRAAAAMGITIGPQVVVNAA